MGSATSAICSGANRKIYSDQSDYSRTIDNELRNEAKRRGKIIKILLLGPSDSGKSTIVRLLHTDGFSIEERRHYRYTIYSNLMDCCSHIARGIQKLEKIDVPSTEQQLVQRFADYFDGQQYFDFINEYQSLIGMISTFLNLSSVNSACKMLGEFNVPDNVYYLLNEKQRLLAPEYNPSKEDIINTRASTRGIYEINFAFRDFTIRLIDVGGQKTERRKWIHCFEDVHAVLFIVSLSCYHQMLEEDSTLNQMEDTLNVFSAIYRNQFLCHTFFVMFYNKKDLLRKKLPTIPLEKYYPDFKEKLRPEMNEREVCKEAIRFLKQMFMQMKADDGRQIYTHLTNATNSKNIDFVFNATCDNLISKNMEQAGLN